MKRAATIILTAGAMALATNGVALAAVSGLCPTARKEIGASSKRQSSVLERSISPNWRPSKKPRDERAISAVVKDFNRALQNGDSEKIWKDLIPKNSRGAVAVAMGGDPDSGDFSIQIYRSIKGFQEGRKVAVGGLGDGVKKDPGSLEIDRLELESDGNLAVAIIRYRNARSLPVILVESDNTWKIDLATMMSVNKPKLIETATARSKELVAADHTDTANGLLRDAMGLEGAFKRTEKKPLSSFMAPSALGQFKLQLGRFNEMRGVFNEISPQA